MKIWQKILLTSFLILILFVSLDVFFLSQLKQQKQKVHEIKDTNIQIALKAGDLKLAVVQVQQFLSDISATRAAEGYADGFSEAEKHAVLVKQLLSEIAQMNPDLKSELDGIQAAFNEYYVQGKTMAQAYIQGGPEQGNLLMGEFDSKAIAINDRVDLFKNTEIEHVEQSVEQLESRVQTISQTIFIFSIIVIVLFLIIAYVISRSITRPLEQVNRQMKEIADGEGDLTKELSIRSTDEIGSLALSFNQMIGNLRNIIQQVKDSSEQVLTASNELRGSAEQTASATNHIAASIQQVASGASIQANHLSENTKTMEQLSIGISHIAESSLVAYETSEQSAREAQQGSNQLQDSVNQMNTIRDHVEQLVAVMLTLEQRSEEIGKITQLISSVAEQTDLLALNASIEASRAGEQGRGFNVVANEIKKLAMQSKQSAGEIRSLISEIQKEIHQATDLSEAGKQQVVTGTEMVEHANAVFQHILQSSYKVVDQVQKASTASEQMSASAQEMSASLEQVSTIAQQSSQGAEAVSSSSEEQLATVEEMTASADSLRGLALQLGQIISRFKI